MIDTARINFEPAFIATCDLAHRLADNTKEKQTVGLSSDGFFYVVGDSKENVGKSYTAICEVEPRTDARQFASAAVENFTGIRRGYIIEAALTHLRTVENYVGLDSEYLAEIMRNFFVAYFDTFRKVVDECEAAGKIKVSFDPNAAGRARLQAAALDFIRRAPDLVFKDSNRIARFMADFFTATIDDFRPKEIAPDDDETKIELVETAAAIFGKDKLTPDALETLNHAHGSGDGDRRAVAGRFDEIKLDEKSLSDFAADLIASHFKDNLADRRRPAGRQLDKLETVVAGIPTDELVSINYMLEISDEPDDDPVKSAICRAIFSRGLKLYLDRFGELIKVNSETTGGAGRSGGETLTDIDENTTGDALNGLTIFCEKCGKIRATDRLGNCIVCRERAADERRQLDDPKNCSYCRSPLPDAGYFEIVRADAAGKPVVCSRICFDGFNSDARQCSNCKRLFVGAAQIDAQNVFCSPECKFNFYAE